jgi:hypothetical protein
VSKKTGRLRFVGRVWKGPDGDDERGRRIASRGRRDQEIRGSNLLNASPHPPIKVVDRKGFSASSTKLFKSPESALELGLGNGSGSCAFPIVRSGNRKLFEFGEETSSTNFGHRRLLIRRETGDEILRGI